MTLDLVSRQMRACAPSMGSLSEFRAIQKAEVGAPDGALPVPDEMHALPKAIGHLYLFLRKTVQIGPSVCHSDSSG